MTKEEHVMTHQSIHSKLAIQGGSPYRTTPFPKRTPFGDEIITGPSTDAGSIIPILYQGCIPIFADVDETYNMDPADVESKITDRTAAIMAIHLFGNACQIDALADCDGRQYLPLIKDCSQTLATQYKGRDIEDIAGAIHKVAELLPKT
jgi:dTDP-4-amino-4,6-dideoxygalactose transaminase